MTESAQLPAALPGWVKEEFQAFLAHLNEVVDVLHLSTQGIAFLRGKPRLLQQILEFQDTLEEEKARLAMAVRERDLAQRELDNGFPLLHQHATVSLWGSLEALVLSLVANWLLNRRDAWQVDDVRRLRVRIGEYEALDQYDKCLWVIDSLDKELSAPLKAGVTRFEALLQPFGLDGEVPEPCRKIIFELSQVRHVIVHRRAIADRRFIQACPWLRLSVGNPVKIPHEQWLQYHGAVFDYIEELLQRVRVAHGLERLPYLTKSGVRNTAWFSSMSSSAASEG